MDLNRISQLANYPKVCAQCEKHLPDSARFCPRCGSGNVVDRKETLKLRFCSHCRSEPIMADARTFFCPACGSKLSDYVAGGRMGPPPLPQPPTRRRKRRFFFLLPVFFAFFFAYSWSSTTHRPEPARLHIYNSNPSFPEPVAQDPYRDFVTIDPVNPMDSRPLIVVDPAKNPRIPPPPTPIQPAKPNPDYFPIEK